MSTEKTATPTNDDIEVVLTQRALTIRHYGTSRKYGGIRTYQIGREDAAVLESLGWRTVHRAQSYTYMEPPAYLVTVLKETPVRITTPDDGSIARLIARVRERPDVAQHGMLGPAAWRYTPRATHRMRTITISNGVPVEGEEISVHPAHFTIACRPWSDYRAFPDDENEKGAP